MSVVSWGFGAAGALGTGETRDELLPVVVESALRGKHVTAIAAGEQHSLALDDLGNVYSWGRNREGQCGHNATQHAFAAPTRVEHLLRERIVAVAAGGHQSFAVTDDGRLYRWGLFHVLAGSDSVATYFGMGDLNNNAELRDMIDRSHYLYFANKDDFGPEDLNVREMIESTGALRRRVVRVPELLPIGPAEGEETVDGRPVTEADRRVVDVAVGYGFYLIVTASGAVYSLGFNDKGQLGHGDRFVKDTPTRIAALAPYKIVKVAAGQQHSVAVSSEGLLFTWGGGTFGIGHGDTRDVMTPRLVSALRDVRIADVSCGTHHTFCLAREPDQLVFSFGHGEYGQQGVGDVDGEGGGDQRNALLPRLFELRSGVGAETRRVSEISCGHLHTLFRLSDGSLWSCGWGANGVLGHGDRKYRLSPQQIRALEGDSIVAAVGGWKHNVVIREGATTFAFDFERLITASSPLSDVVFVVENKRIAAHSVIVTARCARIASMLAFHRRFCARNEAPDAAPVIVVPNARFVAFQAFLRYLYTDNLKVPTFFLPAVADLARRFALPRLVALAERVPNDASGMGRPVRHGASRTPISTDSTFSDDLSEMVGSARFADVAFVVRDEADAEATVEVPAHKAVLVARCAYFRALWDTSRGFNDLERRAITVPFAAPVLLVVLRYIYAGSGTRRLIDGENALEVLSAADFFLLDGLKQICEDVLEKTLLSDMEMLGDGDLMQNIQDVAQRHSARRLEAFCSWHVRPEPAAPAAATADIK